MIQDPSKSLTLIVYNTPKPPKYIKVNKLLIKAVVFSIPVLIITSLIISLLTTANMKRKLDKARSQEPEIILGLKNEIKSLNTQIKQLSATSTELTAKIAKGAAKASLNSMALFTTPLGFEDKRAEDSVKIENISTQKNSKNISLKFDVLNNKTGKLSGYITIVQYYNDGMQFYPSYELSAPHFHLDYSKGESFTISRFRPLLAEFPIVTSNKVWYKIYIFSRTGNLMAQKNVGPFELK